MHLSLKSLTCHRGGRRLFAPLSAELGPGEALMVRGPNGSGKTSLLRILAGFLEAAGGEMRWRAKRGDPWQEDGLEAYIAWLGHAGGVKAQLTVLENLEFWTALAGGGAFDPQAALSVLGLSGLEDMRAGLLSAGQQRRLALSRLPLAARPLWLLDEPDTGLDTASREALAALLNRHLAAGGMAVIASHGTIDLPGGRTLTLRAAA